MSTNAMPFRAALGEIFEAHCVAAVLVGSMAVFALGWAGARLLKLPREGAALSALGMTCSNTGYIGYPLAVLVIGPGAAVAMAMNMLAAVVTVNVALVLLRH
jgi:malonate transporter